MFLLGQVFPVVVSDLFHSRAREIASKFKDKNGYEIPARP